VLIVGVPGSDRVVALTDALGHAGVPHRLVPWRLAIDAPESVVPAPGELVRVDSPGSDDATSRALIRLGGGDDGPRAEGAWRPGRAWATGLLRVMSALPAGTHPADSVATMTDKHACRLHLADRGVPVPAGALAPTTPEALRSWIDERRWTQVFVKARWGSSGAGVFAWRRAGGREQLTTTLQRKDGALFQNKRLQRYASAEEIDDLLAPVLGDGAIVERWIPKQGVGDRVFDLRVVVLDGRPVLRVARLARGPITNLHLDAQRADPADLLDRPTLDAVDALATQVAAGFPRHRCFGIDVLVDTANRLYVCECNAWGDNVRRVHSEGKTIWALQAEAYRTSRA